MAKMLGRSHYWNSRYCPWRDSDGQSGPTPRPVQTAFKRRQRSRERSEVRRITDEHR